MALTQGVRQASNTVVRSIENAPMVFAYQGGVYSGMAMEASGLSTMPSMRYGSRSAGRSGVVAEYRGGAKSSNYDTLIDNAFTNRLSQSLNAKEDLSTKLKLLEKAQNNHDKYTILPDGRIRYSFRETPSRKQGNTRGAAHVVEYNHKTNNVRSWHECRDHYGNIIRVHPKTINGQIVESQHYPPTKKELKACTLRNKL